MVHLLPANLWPRTSRSKRSARTARRSNKPKRVWGDPGLVRFDVQSEFKLDEFREIWTRVLAHPDYRPGLPSMWVMSPASIAKLQHEDVAAVAGDIKRMQVARGGRWKIAIVVSTPVDFGMSRMLQILAADGPAMIRLFEDEEEAHAWAIEPIQDAE